MMMIVAILVALVVLYWLGSLVYRYSTNAAERSRINRRPLQFVPVLLAIVFLGMLLLGFETPYGNLSILIGEHQFRIWVVGLIGCIATMAVYFLSRGASK